MATQTVNQVERIEEQPLDLHDLYRTNAACGYDQEIVLKQFQVQEIAARLRGIASITAVLIAEGSDVSLGGWMRHGLLEAVQALNTDMQTRLEKINDQAQKAAVVCRA